MVERGLCGDANDGIQYVRIDGKVPVKKRGHVLLQFQNDPNIRVILVTVSCGACGSVFLYNLRCTLTKTDMCCSLNLTAASRVHLLEPQWNPSLEDQALARVHRLGQTRPVTTIRYVMENSFEEVWTSSTCAISFFFLHIRELISVRKHVLKVQDRKKLLATALLSNGSFITVSAPPIRSLIIPKPFTPSLTSIFSFAESAGTCLPSVTSQNYFIEHLLSVQFAVVERANIF
jgi:hypothetical protein